MKLIKRELEKFSQIEPIYFALASYKRSVERKDIGDDWDEVLAYNEITSEEFDRFESWWFSADGEMLVEKIKMDLVNSLMLSVPKSEQKRFENLFEIANWRDFISELSGIFVEDPNDFQQYAVENGLFSELEESDFVEIGLDAQVTIDILQDWFNDRSREALAILVACFSKLIPLRTQAG